MKVRIAHIIIDDKFIDGAMSLFNSIEELENVLYIYGHVRRLQYVKTSHINFFKDNSVFDELNKFDVIILHSLPAFPIKYIKQIRKEIKVVWFAWGYDIYEKPYDLISVKLFGPQTRKIARKERLNDFFDWGILLRNIVIRYYLKSALKRIDYFSGVFPYEIDMLKTNRKEFCAAPLDFYYGSNNFFVPEEPSRDIKHGKKNIIIGNSGNLTGNHLDVLKTISNINIDKDAKIIIPLSYGASLNYANQVESVAENIFPGQVKALGNFLPLEDYLNLISNCKTAVFAHERQQATDNIFMQLLYGARVYMSKTSAAFNYLKSLGLNIYSIQDDMDLFSKELSDDEVFVNRKILSDYYSSSKLINRVKIIIDVLMKDCKKNET